MTPAQLDALRALSTAGDSEVSAWRRRTAATPTPVVNIKAAAALVDLGYARRHPLTWTPHGHSFRYTITDDGRAALADESQPAGDTP